MPTPVNISPRLDQIDAERFEAMLNSDSFGLVRVRILAELERAKGDCETKDKDIDVLRAQGRAAALRAVMELPATILKEIRAKATR